MSSRAARLKTARINAGLKQTEVAMMLNKSVSTIKSWEREDGSKPGSLEDIARVCDLYKISVDYYVSGKEYQLESDAEDSLFLKQFKTLPESSREIIKALIEEMLK